MNPEHVRCLRCLLKQPYCLCASIPRVETRTRFLVVRHVIESRKRSNSARLAALALPACEIVDYGDRCAPFSEARLLEKDTWLLYPAGPSSWDSGRPPPRRVVVLDGSWRQARRMFLKIPELRRLPRLALPAPIVPPLRRLRRASPAHALATLEAVAHALELLEGEDLARPLHDLYARFVAASIRCSDGARRWRTVDTPGEPTP